MNSITKWLADPDAVDYPFPYQIGDQISLALAIQSAPPNYSLPN